MTEAEKYLLLATEGFETEDWYEEKDHGHQITREQWDEFQGHWARIREMASEFRDAPWIDNRPKRNWDDLTPMEKAFRRYIVPQIQEDIYKANMIFKNYKEATSD